MDEMVVARAWRTSTRCETAACVEVATGWSTSGRCESGDCVEIATCSCDGAEVLMRDSKDPDGPVLAFSRTAWASFVEGIKRDEFNA